MTIFLYTLLGLNLISILLYFLSFHIESRSYFDSKEEIARLLILAFIGAVFIPIWIFNFTKSEIKRRKMRKSTAAIMRSIVESSNL